jgi:hypothetical protein
MRKAWIPALLGALLFSPACAGALSLGLDIGVSPQLGVAFASSPDVGISGAALEAALLVSSGPLQGEAGVEAGASPIGWQVLFPLRAGISLPLAPFSLDILAEAAPGLALFRPSPLLMVAAGALARAAWEILPGFALYLSVGARWTLCPAYGDFTGVAYSSIDLPAVIGVRWAFR